MLLYIFLICPDQNMRLPSDGSYDAGLLWAQVLWLTPVWSNTPTPQEQLSNADVPIQTAPLSVLTSVWRLTKEVPDCFVTGAPFGKCELSVFICRDRMLSRENRGPLSCPGPVRNLNFLERKQEVYSWLDLQIFRTRFSVAKSKLT